MQLIRDIEKAQSITKWSQSMRMRRLLSTNILQHFKEKDTILKKEAAMKQKTNDDLNTLKRDLQLDFRDIFHRKIKPSASLKMIYKDCVVIFEKDGKDQRNWQISKLQ